MSQITFIIFYFGKFPWYYDLFLKSCKANEGYHFVIFSDNFSVEKTEKNITEVPFSISAFNLLASKKLGFDISIKNGTKICDLRPAFGLIFEDYIRDSEFWGYSDIDLVLGKLSTFLTKDVVQTFDFISVSRYYPSGYFAIARNNEKMKFLFTESNSYQATFQAKTNLLFEECGGYYTEVMQGINILDTACPHETIHHVLEKNKTEIKILFKQLAEEEMSAPVRVNDSRVTRGEDEFILFHFTKWKKNLFVNESTIRVPKKDVKIFKYSIQADSWLGNLAGRSYDFLCLCKMRMSLFIDSMSPVVVSQLLKAGHYTYMIFSIEVIHEDTQTVLIYDDVKYTIASSVIFPGLYFVPKADLYVKPMGGNLLVIYPEGDTVQFSKGQT